MIKLMKVYISALSRAFTNLIMPKESHIYIYNFYMLIIRLRFFKRLLYTTSIECRVSEPCFKRGSVWKSCGSTRLEWEKIYIGLKQKLMLTILNDNTEKNPTSINMRRISPNFESKGLPSWKPVRYRVFVQILDVDMP